MAQKKKEKRKRCCNDTWMVTWNNWKRIGDFPLKLLVKEKVESKEWQYFCGKPEIGNESGLDHYQCFLETPKGRMDKNVLIKAFDTIDKGIDILAMSYGCTDDMRNYIKKIETTDGEFFEMGEYEVRWKGKGARNDLHDFKNAIKKETPRYNMYEMFFEEMSKHRAAYFDYKTCLQKKKMMDLVKEQMCSGEPKGIQTTIYYGEGNVGKTFKAIKKLLNEKDFWFINFNNENYFHDWEYEKNVLFDDFYGNIPYNLFLDITDTTRKPIRLRQLYGFIYPCWEKLFITSNKPPWEWYSCYDVKAMCKRFKKIIKIYRDDEGNIKKHPHTEDEILERFTNGKKEKSKNFRGGINVTENVHIHNKNNDLGKLAELINSSHKRIFDKTIDSLRDHVPVDLMFKKFKGV